MLRTKPKFKYCGLTLILSNPSRFDRTNLLTASGGHAFNECLRPDFNTMHCDVRVVEDKSPLLEGTKCVMVLGEYAMLWCLPDTKGNTLNELRGSVLQYQGLPCIP